MLIVEDLTNGKRTSSPAPISIRSRRSSPAIRFQHRESLARSRSNSPSPRQVPITVSDQPLVPARSLSNTTISEDVMGQSIDHHLQDCTDEDCACGWETYVINLCHGCENPTAPERVRVSIHKLLHQEKDNPLLRDYEPSKIRHVHLPANNMTWAEVSLTIISG
jgi:hypothetical protein